MRMYLTAIAVALVVGVGISVGVQFPALVDTIQRNLKQNWVLGLLAAVIISCVITHHFWKFRRYLRVWSVYGAYLFLHFTVAVPAVGRIGVIKSGHKEALYFWAIVLVEFWAVISVLKQVTATLPAEGEQTQR